MNPKILRRAGAWIATIAMAFNAAWPLLAQAKPFDPLGEICSVQSQKAGTGHGGSTGLPGGGTACSHCTLCSPAPGKVLAHSGNVPLVAALPREAELLSATVVVPARESSASFPVHPRAPPFSG